MNRATKIPESIARRELPLIRVLLLSSALIYLVWGLVSAFMYPYLYDPFWLRLIVIFFAIIAFALTFQARLYETQFDFLVLFPATPMLLHSWMLLLANRWHPFNLIATLTIMWGVVSLVRSRLTAIVLAVSFFLCISIIAWSKAAEVHWVVMSLMAGSILATGLLGSLSRNEILRAYIAEESKSRDILDNLAEGVIIFDSSGRIVSVNPAAPILMGLPEDQMLGKGASHPDWKTFHEDGRLFHPDHFPISVALRTKQPVRSIPIVIEKPWGERSVISVSANPVFKPSSKKNEERELEYVIVTFNDITKVREAQKKLEEQQLLLVNNSKFTTFGEMAAGIAHEINNPITVIAARATQIRELAENESLSAEKVLPLIDRVDTTLNRINRITTSMRALFRDGTQDPMIPARLHEIVEETYDLTAVALQNAQIKFENKIDPSLEIDCRPSEMGQLVLNMVANAKDAITHLPERWIRIESSIVENTDKQIEIRFYDSGLGISPDLREKILQPFFTTKAPGQGTGLGLSISKSIAKSHGGDLWIDDQSMRTCFVLQLPLPKEII